MNNQTNIPVFVISIARSQERRRAIIDHPTSIGVNMHSGAIGCYLSHIEVYKKIITNEIPVALVLEDDARLNALIKDLLQTGVKTNEFDYCFLDRDDHNDRRPVFYDLDSTIEIGNDFKAFQLSDGPQTLHAYFISFSSAVKRLDNAFPIIKPIDLYEHLPYSIRFYAIVSPKAAWVSEYSLESSTSNKKSQLSELSWQTLRRWPLFYKIRDCLKFKPLISALTINKLKKAGKLDSTKRWRPLPFGREILLP